MDLACCPVSGIPRWNFLAEVPCVAFSWVEFLDQFVRWKFAGGMFFAGKSSRWNFLVGRFLIWVPWVEFLRRKLLASV